MCILIRMSIACWNSNNQQIFICQIGYLWCYLTYVCPLHTETLTTNKYLTIKLVICSVCGFFFLVAIYKDTQKCKGKERVLAFYQLYLGTESKNVLLSVVTTGHSTMPAKKKKIRIEWKLMNLHINLSIILLPFCKIYHSTHG